MALIKLNTRSIPDNAVTPAKVSQNLGPRNLIINGAMQVSQRGTTFTTPASDGQLTDRWSVLANVNGASKVTYSQVTDSPNEFAYSIKADVATALSLGASDYHILRYNGFEQQDIDQLAMGSSDAKEITLSFWVKSNKTGTLVAELQMNSVEASGASVELGKTYTINAANTWEKKTLTYPANTGHTSNQSGVSRGMLLYMWLASGSNYQAGSIDTTWGVNTNRTTGQDNYLDSTSNEIYWTGFQLEAGNTATDFEHRTFAEEISLCHRYFRVVGPYGNPRATGGNDFFLVNVMHNNENRLCAPYFDTPFRSAPSVTLINHSNGGTGAITEFSSGTVRSQTSFSEIGLHGGGYPQFNGNFGNPARWRAEYNAEL